MFDNLEILRMSQGLAKHAGTRQELIARNVANADTPGYRAQDVASFSETYRSSSDSAALRVTRPGHVDASAPGPAQARPVDAPGSSAPNGNTVSIETEMVKATGVRQDFDMALAIYKSSLDILRSAIGRGR